MNLATFFESKNIVMEVESQERINSLLEIMSKIPHNGRLRNKDKALRDLIEREKLSSTAIGGGFAVPHVFTEEANLPTLIFARSLKGIEFQSLDHRPVHLVLLAFAHPRKKIFFIQCLYHIVRLLKDKTVFHDLLEAKNPDEVLKVFANRGERMSFELFKPIGHSMEQSGEEHQAAVNPSLANTRTVVGHFLGRAAEEVGV